MSTYKDLDKEARKLSLFVNRGGLSLIADTPNHYGNVLRCYLKAWMLLYSGTFTDVTPEAQLMVNSALGTYKYLGIGQESVKKLRQ